MNSLRQPTSIASRLVWSLMGFTLLSGFVHMEAQATSASSAGSPGSTYQVKVEVPAGTPLPVELGGHVPMRKGMLLNCKLLYPVYADNDLVIPKGSMVKGSVIALRPDKSRRLKGRLWGDFTPFHTPVVRFTEVVLPDGVAESIVSDDAADGAPVLHLTTPVKVTAHSLIMRQIMQFKAQAKESLDMMTAPGRGDRLAQFLYQQLPYHPERIDAGTMWTVTLEKPLTLEATLPESTTAKKPIVAPVTPKTKHPIALLKRPGVKAQETATAASVLGDVAKSEGPAMGQKPISLDAYLEQTISSANESAGNTFDAVVAEPVFNAKHRIVVPQGALLEGTITEAKPAKWFGRSGKLRFDFRELKMPGGGSTQPVLGTLAGADTNAAQNMKIDVEGGVQSKPKDRVIVPLMLTFLAGRALDDDGSIAGHAAVSSNGFGIIGRVVGILAGSRNLAAGIGFYAAGLSLYERWIARGQNVTFVKNTRIEVSTTSTSNLLPVPAVPGVH